MWVDRVWAVETAEKAREFDWDWTRAGVDRFLESVDAVARVSGTDERIDYAVITIADTPGVAEANTRQLNAHALHLVGTGLRTLLGDRHGTRVGAVAGTRWSFPKVVIGVSSNGRAVELWLMNPVEHERIAALERQEITDLMSAPAWTAFIDAIPVLANADPGAWSRSDVVRMIAVAGWPVEVVEQGMPAALAAEFGAASLNAMSTMNHQLCHGYGEFQFLWLRHRVSEETSGPVYAAALEVCAQVLGTPSFVGGPRTFATWRRADTTVTLSRQLWEGSGCVQLELVPTRAREHEERARAAANSGWVASESWRARPESDSGDADLDGLWRAPTRRALEWDLFDRFADDLFTSLGADLLLLRPYVCMVAWVIVAGEPASLVAQGWFDAREYLVETWEGGEKVYREYVPGRAGGWQIAEVVGRVARAVVDSPERLRYWAWAFDHDGNDRLWDFRLGITYSPDQR